MKRARIIGTGSFLPPTEVTNEELIKFLGLKKADNWPEEKMGIKKRRLDFDLQANEKPPYGAFYDTDLAEKASRLALADAKVRPEDVDYLIHITCTADRIHFQASTLDLSKRLGIASGARRNHIDSGCAGVSQGLDLARVFIEAGESKNVLLVASNSSSSFLDRDRYMRTNTWLGVVIFGDGAGAMVLQGVEAGEAGVSHVFYEIDPTHPLVDYKGGGGRFPTSKATMDDHIYNMDAKDVGEMFPRAMARNIEKMKEIMPSFDLSKFARVYIHQANRYFVERFAEAIELPKEKFGINVDRYGNTSAASTLILLDEDRKNGLVKEGDLILFLWVGAGMVNGGAVIKL